MKKLLSIALAVTLAASSFATLAQDKKKEDVKSAGGSNVTTPAQDKVTTGTDKPKKESKGASIPKPKHQGKRKTETQRTDKK